MIQKQLQPPEPCLSTKMIPLLVILRFWYLWFFDSDTCDAKSNDLHMALREDKMSYAKYK